MRKLAFVLLLLFVAIPLAAGKTKHKEKRFEPVTITNPAQAAGRYVGIDPDFVIELRGSRGTLRNFKRTATLEHVVYEGSELRATIVYERGGREPLHATFVNRIKNGETAFGLRLRNIDIPVDEHTTLQNLFCRRE